MFEAPPVDSDLFEKTRSLLTHDFVRILGYFLEDGAKAVAEIGDGFRSRDAARMIRPAHTLKTEARQFGALPLGDLAERIEGLARRCVEVGDAPDELLVPIAKLAPLWRETVAVFERETNPLVERGRATVASFGRAEGTNQSFGRL